MYPPAADQGEARAQASLGRMYAKGQGVPQDYSKAINSPAKPPALPERIEAVLRLRD